MEENIRTEHNTQNLTEKSVTVSVIMPVYNTDEGYLKEAIESVLQQTYKDYELLILNDSPENQALHELILTYTDKRIKYLENKCHMGIPQSYNHLLAQATGKYVAIMNHDDIMLPKRLAKQVAYMEAHPEVGLLGTAYKKFGEINRFKTIKNPSNHDDISSYLLFKSIIHHPTIMMRRQVIVDHNINYNENFISLNDRILCYDFSRHCKLANLPDVLYKYRFHTGMTSKVKKEIIRQERAMYHRLWFANYNILLEPEEINIFDNYVTYGRCKITSIDILQKVLKTLEKISAINHERHFLPLEPFDKVCAKYFMKRCFNAVYNGRIDVSEYIKQTTLPLNGRALLKLSNGIFGWRK